MAQEFGLGIGFRKLQMGWKKLALETNMELQVWAEQTMYIFLKILIKNIWLL